MTPSKAPTRRRHTARGLRMAQNPHRSRLKCAASPTRPGTAPVGAKKLAQHRPSSSISAKKLAQHATKRQFWAIFRAQGELCRAHTHHQTSRANFVALTPTIRPAGRRISRIRSDNAATLKPTTPLLAPNKEPLKPASPLPPKNAPKTPVSHPQRRHRFQLRLDLRPQR